MAGPARRRPFPYDMIIAGQGVMLGHKDDKTANPLVGTKVMAFDQAAPSDYRYDTQPPLYERVQPYADMSKGFGLRMQSGYEDRKYRYALNAELSTGQWMKGPLLTTYSPSYANTPGSGVDGLVEMSGNLYGFAGRYFLQYNAGTDSWATIQDFGASAVVLDACAFAPPGGSTKYIFIALGEQQNAWYFDGSVFTQFATFRAYAFQQTAKEFWRAGGTSASVQVNAVSKVDTAADPTVEANWGATTSFQVGDRSARVVKLGLTSSGAMLIFKQDGIYTLEDSDGTDTHLFPYTAAYAGAGADSDNGKWWGIFGNDTFVTYSKTTFKLEPSVSITGSVSLTGSEIGPERNIENDSPVRGRVTAFAANGPLNAYAGLYNDDTGGSYLLKYSSWAPAEVAGGELDMAKRMDAWHGSITPLLPGKVTSLLRTTIGAPSGHYRLVVGLGDATIRSFTLACTANPATCSSYRFDTSNDGQVFLPYWHGTFLADAKSLRSVSMIGNLTSDYFAQLKYKTDPALPTFQDFGTNFVGNRQKTDFATNTAAYLAEFQVVLKHGAGGTTSSSPVLDAVAIHHSVRPSLILEYTFSVLAADGLVRRNGTPYKSIGSTQLRSVLRTAAGAVGAVTVYLPDESSQQLAVTNYAESLAWDERLRRWQAALDIKAVQYQVNTLYGTWGRVAAYTWGSGQSYNWLQLTGI